MDESFNPAELLNSEALAEELLRRANIETDLLERLATVLDDRTFDVFLFLWKYAPATEEQMRKIFNRVTLRRSLQKLEAGQAVKKKKVYSDFQYSVQK